MLAGFPPGENRPDGCGSAESGCDPDHVAGENFAEV